MLFPNWKTLVVGSILYCVPLVGTMLMPEELDRTAYIIQATLERAPYVWVPQEQMDDLPPGSATVSQSLLPGIS